MRSTEIKFRVWTGSQMFCEPYCETERLNDVFREIGGRVFMQFTGIKDSNATDVYESDVVRAKYLDDYNDVVSVVGEVAFSSGVFELRWGTSHMPLSKLWQLEILGNVFEKPDLLPWGRYE